MDSSLGTLRGLFWLAVPIVSGFVLGTIIPGSSFIAQPGLRLVSSILGWTYMSAWSLSFYPQLFLNHVRKDIEGLSVDFQVLNLMGFGCYSVYNCMMYWSGAIRSQYASLHDGHMPALHMNDVVFSCHAFIVTLLVFIQCCMYGSLRSSLSMWTVAFCSVAFFVSIAWAALLFWGQIDAPLLEYFDGLTWIYFLSYIKLLITLTKYVPQIFLNYIRKSTIGWSAWNANLDLMGGLLSLSQAVLDSFAIHHWSSITGNPVKFGLGLVSMLYDATLMFQHYLLYPDSLHEAKDLLHEEAEAFFRSSSTGRSEEDS